MKISVIIPTLQLNKRFKILLALLNSDPSVGEIIIIDNSCQGFTHKFNKVRVIIPKANLYVNESWNIGIQEAKFEYFALFNDDVLVPKNFCSAVLPLLSDKIGIVGMTQTYVENLTIDKFNSLPQNAALSLKTLRTCHYCFGIIMFGHKSSYHQIPKGLLIFKGDDYLVLMNRQLKKQNYFLLGCEIYHLVSLSSGKKEFNPIRESDRLNYEKIYKQYSQFYYKDKFFYFLGKFLCLFIPVQAWRWKLRLFLNS